MTSSNKILVNFAGGEVAPEILSRNDIPLAQKVVQRMQNFIPLTQGPATFRSGTKYVNHTRLNRNAVLIPFQFSDIQAYLIEATDFRFRFFKDEGAVLETAKTITGVTQANPGVITSAGHGYSDGDEVYISSVGGMTELNGKFYLVDYINANTFSLTDIDGNAINTSSYTAYTSGGTCERIYEIPTPYREQDLETLEYAQNADTMYITHEDYPPLKLVRTADTNWSLSTFSRTSDPFLAALTITGLTQANPGVVTTGANHNLVANDLVYIMSVGGMAQINNILYKVNTTPTATTFTVKDVNTGTAINTTSYTAYTTGGVAFKVEDRNYPRAVTFTDDGRLMYGGTLNKPETFWASRSPNSSSGAVRYDDFTTGTDADHAVIFTLAPLRGKVDSIRWMTNTDKYIAVGTFGSIRRVYGGTETEAIAPNSITAKAANSDGVTQTLPVLDGPTLLYVGRSGSLESLEYDYTIDGYSPDSKNTVSNHIVATGLKQIVFQRSSSNIVWGVRNDGLLVGMTHKPKENIAGWHRHPIGENGKAKWMGVMPRESSNDQLWLVVERTVGETTRRFIEFMSDPPDFPSILDFFTEGLPDTEANDIERFENYLFELQKDAIHLDASTTYDGSVYGTNAGASITIGPGAEEPDGLGATDIVVTASASVFTSGMVGRQIWGAYTTEGIGGGRIEITEYVSGTEIKGTVLDTFPASAEYEAGDWFITATELSGLDYLEGETVGIIADGAAPDPQLVENGTINITEPASVIHVGLRYLGLLVTLPIDQGGTDGPAQNKLKILEKVAIRFLNSSGVQFGTRPYRLTNLGLRRLNQPTGKPIPLYTGVESQLYNDRHDIDKVLVIVQDQPLPCTLAGLDIYMETSNE